jgi:hypothetical protein
MYTTLQNRNVLKHVQTSIKQAVASTFSISWCKISPYLIFKLYDANSHMTELNYPKLSIPMKKLEQELHWS